MPCRDTHALRLRTRLGRRRTRVGRLEVGAIDVCNRPPLGGVFDDHPAPSLRVRSGRRLMCNVDAFDQHIARHRTREVQALAYAARCGQHLVGGEPQSFTCWPFTCWSFSHAVLCESWSCDFCAAISDQYGIVPPSTGNMHPVMFLAASEAISTATAATSSTLFGRLIADSELNAAMSAS